MTDFIAEVSSNHNRDLARCLSFVEKATEIGCRGIKFQLFRVRELFAPEILERSEKHRVRSNWELPEDFLPEIAKACRARGLSFVCTPFYLHAVDVLFPYVDVYKIASYELLWKDLLRLCAETGKPVMLSTGMATLEEVKEAVDVLVSSGCRDLVLLHCVSSYPVPPGECNLAAIGTLRNELGFPVGWSDHSVNPGVVYRAVHRWGATIVEFHLDLEGSGDEYAQGHCWLPHDIQRVIEAIRLGFAADGTGEKTPTPSELKDRAWRADPSDGLRPMLETRKSWRR